MIRRWSAWRCPTCRLLQKLGIDVAGAHGRSGAIPASDRRLRLRHDHDDLSGGRHSRQRTARLLHLCGEQGTGQLQRSRDLRPGGGCAGRAGGHGAGPRDADDRGARAGPGAAVALVPGAELGQPGLPHRLLGPLRLSGQADPRRVQLRHVVGGSGEGGGDSTRRGSSEARHDSSSP